MATPPTQDIVNHPFNYLLLLLVLLLLLLLLLLKMHLI